MWYNVIPHFVPLNLNLYPTSQTKAKGLDSSIFRNYTRYVPRNVYPVIEQPIVPLTYIPNFVGNQFHTMVQLVTGKDMQPIQQPITASMLTIVHVTTSLPTYVLKVLITNHRKENNLETHLEEIHPEEIHLENHLLIHLLDLLDGQHLTHACLYHHGINHLLCNMYQN